MLFVSHLNLQLNEIQELAYLFQIVPPCLFIDVLTFRLHEHYSFDPTHLIQVW